MTSGGLYHLVVMNYVNWRSYRPCLFSLPLRRLLAIMFFSSPDMPREDFVLPEWKLIYWPSSSIYWSTLISPSILHEM